MPNLQVGVCVRPRAHAGELDIAELCADTVGGVGDGVVRAVQTEIDALDAPSALVVHIHCSRWLHLALRRSHRAEPSSPAVEVNTPVVQCGSRASIEIGVASLRA